MDPWGNVTFGPGIVAVMVGLTYGIIPCGGAAMGWGDPLVEAALLGGVVLLLVSLAVERRVKDPMFPLALFANRAFAAGNLSGLLAAVARGGLSFMIIIWLQGIWLPLHGVSFAPTPLQAGIDTLPQMAGFLVAGPASGRLSDRHGARWFGFAGMVVTAAGLFLLNTLSADFPYWTSAAYLFLVGLGMGIFASPNATAIMNAVPARFRGVASGIRVTVQNAGMMVSMGIFFTLMITSPARTLPGALGAGLSGFHLPPSSVREVAHLPPTVALFAALLGYNPMGVLLPHAVLRTVPAASRSLLTGTAFFPRLIAPPFMEALRTVFLFSMALSLAAAVISLFRGDRFVYEEGLPSPDGPRKAQPTARRDPPPHTTDAADLGS